MEAELLFDVTAAESLKRRHRPQVPRANDAALISDHKAK